MEQHEERLREMEERFKRMIEDIDKSYLRKMQGDMHRCAASCCDNQSYSMERNQNCVENCSSTLENAQQYVQSEIGRLQNRWSRCVMECNDRRRDKIMGEGKTAATGIGREFENCASKCIDAQCDLMHTLGTSIKRALAARNYSGQT